MQSMQRKHMLYNNYQCWLIFQFAFLGDDLGKIWVYDIGEQLAVPQQDDYNKFVNTLQVPTYSIGIKSVSLEYSCDE